MQESTRVWLMLGAPSTHRILGLSFARQWHGGCMHVHWRYPLWDCGYGGVLE